MGNHQIADAVVRLALSLFVLSMGIGGTALYLPAMIASTFFGVLMLALWQDPFPIVCWAVSLVVIRWDRKGIWAALKPSKKQEKSYGE